jgi:hypothetical protein
MRRYQYRADRQNKGKKPPDECNTGTDKNGIWSDTDQSVSLYHTAFCGKETLGISGNRQNGTKN